MILLSLYFLGKIIIFLDIFIDFELKFSFNDFKFFVFCKLVYYDGFD